MHLDINDLCWCGSGKCYKDCHFETDRKLVKMSKNHRMLVPSKDLIKSEKDILGIKEAAKHAKVSWQMISACLNRPNICTAGGYMYKFMQ